MTSELYRLTPPPPGDLPRTLSQDQVALLMEIATPYMTTGAWPIWHYVVDQMDRRGLDAKALIAALPRIGATGTLGPSYGFTVGHDWRMIGDSDKVRLTVAAGLVLNGLRVSLAEPFLRVLHHMITLHLGTVSSPTEVTQTWLDSTELAQAEPDLTPGFIAGLPEILDGEPAAWSGSSRRPNPPDDPTWRKEIRREIRQYAQVKDLEGYVAKVCQITVEQAKAQRQMPGPLLSQLYYPPDSPTGALSTVADRATAQEPGPAAGPAPRPTPVYVKTELIAALEALDTPDLSTAKLVELLRELNFNVAHEQPLACNSLLRAVLDHVPTGFGVGSFAEVISNTPWPRTDKKYLSRLHEFRTQGDDVMHRQMGVRRSRIDMHDLPAPAALNALLDGLAVVLGKRAAAAAPAKP